VTAAPRSGRSKNIVILSLPKDLQLGSGICRCARIDDHRIINQFGKANEEEGYWRSFDFAQDDRTFGDALCASSPR